MTAQQPPAPIRSGTVLVPIDVRVVDANGNPVTDLTAADFTIYEDGVRQEIAHFFPMSFTGPAEPGWRLQLPDGHPLAAVAQDHRTFIILLGRGRLNGPVKGVEALIAFVKEQLLPTDRVGIAAYLRWSDPSTDHGAVVRFLEEYRDRHEDIEGSITADFRHGLIVVTMSNETRRRIDALFRSPGVPPFANLPGGSGNSVSRYVDSNYLRRTLEAAGRVPGEKHLIVLSEAPLPRHRSLRENPDENVLVRWLNQARAALWYINTAGLPGQTMIRGELFIQRGPGTRDASGMGISDHEFFGPTDNRTLATMTGGTATFYSYASKALTALDRGSRFQYLLGYYPQAAATPDTYRTVRVVVNRPEETATARYRHGYRFAAAADDEKRLREAVSDTAIQRTLGRLTGAVPVPFVYGLRPFFPSLKVAGASSLSAGGSPEVLVTLSFDPMRIAFAAEANRYRSTLDLAVLVTDKAGTTVGELNQPLELVLSAEEFARAKKHWLLTRVTVPVRGTPSRVHAVPYDYESDRAFGGKSDVSSARR
jgi:VWFA-related protein